jgi:hypothetical protein
LADSIQQIHSFRAIGVMSSHVANALALEVSAFFRSAGRSWTTPPEIALLLKASLANLSPQQSRTLLHIRLWQQWNATVAQKETAPLLARGREARRLAVQLRDDVLNFD